MIQVTCDCKTMLPISEIEAFQGKLKSIDQENFDKLKKSILRYGFSFPIFVWNKKILDGHQRLAAVKKLISEGEKVKGNKLPIVNIVAKDEKGSLNVIDQKTCKENRDIIFSAIRRSEKATEMMLVELREIKEALIELKVKLELMNGKKDQKLR